MLVGHVQEVLRCESSVAAGALGRTQSAGQHSDVDPGGIHGGDHADEGERVGDLIAEELMDTRVLGT